jgi:hypothetical protein
MRNVIIPVEAQKDAINLCDVTKSDLIVAYSNEKAVGFVIYNDKEWTIQVESDIECDTSRWHDTLVELVRTESKKFPNFSLKVL